MSELRRITADYRLDKLLRASASGSVFRGTDLRSGDTVAVKVITEGGADSDEQREPFLRAAQALQSLHHPSLPRVFDFGFTTAGSAFLVTEYLDGTSLADLSGAPPARVLSLLLQAVGGLAALESAGIAHGNLRADNLLVVAGEEGEQVKLLGIGGAALSPGPSPTNLEEGRRRDLRDLATIGCPLLGTDAAGIAEPEALGSLLAALQGQGADELPSYAEVQRVFRRALAEPPPRPPLAAARRTTQLPQPVDKRLWLGLLVGGGILAGLLAMAVGLFSTRPPVSASKTSTPEAPIAETPTALPPVPAPPAGETPAGLQGMQEPSPAPTPAHASLAGELAAGLRTADLERLRAAVAFVRPQERVALPTGVRRDFERATLALEVDARLARAQRAGRQEDVLADAATLSALLPRSIRAREARERAAAALEAQADADVAAGRLDAALESLESLRRGWLDRPGIAERIERVEAERRDDQRLESLLAAVSREAKANRPQEGLRLLAGGNPNHRFEERFRQAKESLEAQLAGLDRTPPTLAIRAGWEASYGKDESIKVPLLITDDHGIESTELWARPEGGRFERIPLRHISGSQYEAEIPPALHQNKRVEIYATASDPSGNRGQLGSADKPWKLKRKRWYDKLIPGKSDG